MKKVLVEWVDSNFEHGWVSIEQVSGILILTQTIGFLISEDKDKIVIAQNKSEINTYMGIMTIPKPCIKSIKELRLK